MTNGVIENLDTAFKNRCMQAYPLINDMAIAVAILSHCTSNVLCNSFNPSYPLASKIIGIESRKENLVALTRLKPKNRAMLSVIPDLDTPGISDSTCAKPIKNAI